MSLINDALNKVQQQRGEQLLAERLAQAGTPLQPVEVKPKRRASPLVWILVNAAVVIAVLAGNRYFFSDRPQTSERATILSTAPAVVPQSSSAPAKPSFVKAAPVTVEPITAAPEIVVPSTVERVTPAPVERAPIAVVVPVAPPERQITPTMTKPSPFVRPADPVAEPTGAEVEYDLAGMTGVGNNTLLSIIRRSDQRSFLIPVGKTVGEVTAISYNPESDDAVIRVRGRLVKIVMRNASVYFRPAQQ